MLRTVAHDRSQGQAAPLSGGKAMKSLIRALVALSIASSAVAAEAPALPSGAKKLTLPEIVALLDGKTVKYTSYSHPDVWKGKTSFDFKKKKFWGTYPNKGKQTKYDPIDLGVGTEGYCYEKTCDKGMAIYTYKKKIYEVNPDGKVNAVLTK
jgi:hypothetical protein